jgi:hypothetical protein
MPNVSTLEALGQERKKPALHDLLVRDPEGSSSYGFQVVEVTRSSFPEACRYLSDTPWLEDGIASLVVSHFPLSQADIQLLPKGVPWLKAAPDVRVQLQALRTILFQPLEQRGLVCVGFVDLVAVLVNGGEAEISQASGPTAALACDALLSLEAQRAWVSASNMAICVRIRASALLAMSDFDFISERFNYLVTEESLLVVSEGRWDGDGLELTLLAVSARR